MSRYLPLICLALSHTLVDTCAMLVEPLWPDLQKSFNLFGVGALSAAFVIQSMPTSLSQAVFGYVRDRRSTPTILWLGPLLGAICMTAIGLTSSKIVLGILLLVGGVGIGAFHPEAAVAAGRVLPGKRTRSLSLFMFGGALGLGLGPPLSGAIVKTWGLEGLIVLLPFLLVIIALLWRVGRLGTLSEPTPKTKMRMSLGEMFEGRGRLALAIFVICSLRLVPNMGMGKVLSFALDKQGYDSFEIGLTQSLFLVSASVGMFVMAFRFRSGLERKFMIVCPLLGAPMLFALGWEGCPEWLFFPLLALTGLTLWGTTPAMVSYAQQLFPKGTGMASAITMGLSWGLGGLIHTPMTAYYSETQLPQHAFYGFIPCLLLAGVGAWLLPATQTELQMATTANEPATTLSTDPEPADA
jgi:FSR family fosmidomycin resistance protein-like MFS transporter